MIRHTVAFRLVHEPGSTAERSFLDDALVLAGIPGVQNFERSTQVSPGNDYRFQLSMEFADQAAYDAYNVHPVHSAFVADRWNRDVTAFLEADFVPLSDVDG